MRLCRRNVGALSVLAVALTLLSVPGPGAAGSQDACAQRVIRDWYSGGRVDGLYPLVCYRAALRALPADVLHYSDAGQDIRRALAFARRGRDDPGNGPTAEPAESSSAPAPTGTATAEQPVPAAAPFPAANETAGVPREARVAAAVPTAASSVPYPIVALAALTVVLLGAGAGAWLADRRR